ATRRAHPDLIGDNGLFARTRQQAIAGQLGEQGIAQGEGNSSVQQSGVKGHGHGGKLQYQLRIATCNASSMLENTAFRQSRAQHLRLQMQHNGVSILG
ncbi:unnamed protein product, partial [Prorocentrum cordatum]